MSALETEDLLVLAGFSDDGAVLDETQFRRLFDLPAIQGVRCETPTPISATLAKDQARRRQELLDDMTTRNGRWFDTEIDKLDR